MSATHSGEGHAEPAWLGALRTELWGAEAVLTALDDVAAACGDAVDATWVDLRQQSEIAVYVLAAGVLHRVVGPKDTAHDASHPDDAAVTTVEYRAARIGRSASYRVEVVREMGREFVNLYRSWTFTELGEFGSLNLQWPLRENWQRMQDPTPFATAVVRAVLAAGEDR